MASPPPATKCCCCMRWTGLCRSRFILVSTSCASSGLISGGSSTVSSPVRRRRGESGVPLRCFNSCSTWTLYGRGDSALCCWCAVAEGFDADVLLTSFGEDEEDESAAAAAAVAAATAAARFASMSVCWAARQSCSGESSDPVLWCRVGGDKEADDTGGTGEAEEGSPDEPPAAAAAAAAAAASSAGPLQPAPPSEALRW